MKKQIIIFITVALVTVIILFFKWFLLELDIFLHPPHARVPAVLTMLYTAQQVFYADQGYYAEDLARLGVPVPESKFYLYRIPVSTDTSFTISAVVIKEYRKTKIGDSLGINEQGHRSASGWLKKVLPVWNKTEATAIDGHNR
jgi:hypothetical protein